MSSTTAANISKYKPITKYVYVSIGLSVAETDLNAGSIWTIHLFQLLSLSTAFDIQLGIHKTVVYFLAVYLTRFVLPNLDDTL